MKQFFRQNGAILLVISLLLSILITILSVTLGGNFNPFSALVRTVLNPIQTASASAINWVGNVGDYIFRYDEMTEELASLRQQIAQLEGEIRDAQDANRENEQLRELLNLAEKRSDFELASARVSTRKNSNWNETITISKGSDSDIQVGDCVITETGYLLGVVSQVFPTSAVVYTLVDTRLEMGGMVSRSYYSGILEGDFNLMQEGKLRLSYLSNDAQVLPGDTVVTSGMGEQYPSGLVVGTVENLFDDPTGTSRYASIRPAANLDDLIEVFIITDFDVEE